MPKFPSIPRLSIVIPIGKDLVAFENTLISVLENRPSGCEVLVVEDGQYDDPFDLGDEVRFVVAASNDLVDQVAAGAANSQGRFVYVMADGVRATDRWIDAAVEKFEHHDAASVAPVIRNSNTNQIIAAGWIDRTARLCCPACPNQDQVDLRAAYRVGAYLQASMWRREVLVSLAEAFSGQDIVTASYAYEYLLRSAGWRCVLAPDSNLLLDAESLPWDTSSFGRGKRLRAIRAHFNGSAGWGNSLMAAVRGVTANVVRPGNILESIGQAVSPTVALKSARMIRPAAVKSCNEAGTILRIADRQPSIPLRRAA